MIFDNVSLTEVTLASIGTDRMLHVRTLRRTRSGNPGHGEKTSDVDKDKIRCDARGNESGNTVDGESNAQQEDCVAYEFGNVAIRRVEQFAQPVFVASLSSEHFVKDNLEAHRQSVAESSLYLIGTDQHKYRFILKSTLTCIKTVQGPLLRSPVLNFRVLPHLNAALITTRTEIGLQKLPLSGLPHDYLYFTLPESTHKVYLTPGRESLISVGGRENDCLSVWKIDPSQIRTHNPSFRHELEAYYSLIQGGCGGEELKEIQDTFVYFTIQGACLDFVSKQACVLHAPELLSASSINLCHLPFILSALGFFPSEFDLRLLDAEIHLMGLRELDFRHFLALYLNHRPAKAMSYEDVLAAVKYFAHAQAPSQAATFGETSGRSVQVRPSNRNDAKPLPHDVKWEDDVFNQRASVLGRSDSRCSSCSVYTSSDSYSGSSESSKSQSQSSKSPSQSSKSTSQSSKSPSGSNRTSEPNSLTINGSEGSQSASSILGSSSTNIARLLQNHSSTRTADPWMSKETLKEILMKWGEVKWSEDLADEMVDFLFSGDERLDVMEMTARLIEPETVIKLDDVDQIRVYQC